MLPALARARREEPRVPFRTFFNTDGVSTASTENISMWDAGNLFVKGTNNILQTLQATYGLGTNNSAAFVNSTDLLTVVSVLWAVGDPRRPAALLRPLSALCGGFRTAPTQLYNGARGIMTSYEETLDGLMQLTVDNSRKMNEIQLIILGVEGAFVALLAALVMSFFAARVVKRRCAVFSVFLTVPSGILRSLATATFQLDEGGDEVRACVLRVLPATLRCSALELSAPARSTMCPQEQEQQDEEGRAEHEGAVSGNLSMQQASMQAQQDPEAGGGSSAGGAVSGKAARASRDGGANARNGGGVTLKVATEDAQDGADGKAGAAGEEDAVRAPAGCSP